jgi:hypothetical protein
MSVSIPDSSWTDEEDAYCVWSFFMNPVGSLCDYTTPPPGKTISQMLDRFRVIMASKPLQKRVLEHCRGDIIRFHRVRFTVLEDFAIANAQRLLRTTNAMKILEVFGHSFHASRSSDSILGRMTLLQSRGVNVWSVQHTLYQRFKNGILKDLPPEELVSIPTTAADIAPFTHNPSVDAPGFYTEQFFDTVGQLHAHIQPRFARCQFYALRGRGKTIFCSRVHTTIGRRTPSNSVDVDLSVFGFKQISRLHATITLFTDLSFYLEVVGRFVIVNGVVIRNGNVVKLRDGDVVDIGMYLFMFVEHVALMKELRRLKVAAEAQVESV